MSPKKFSWGLCTGTRGEKLVISLSVPVQSPEGVKFLKYSLFTIGIGTRGEINKFSPLVPVRLGEVKRLN